MRGHAGHALPGGTEADLAGTARAVEALDRRIVTAQADVRDYAGLKAALDEGVLTTSAAGLMAYPNIAHYVSAKHGVVGLMRTLALELAPQSIRVNSIHPTQVDTPMIQNEATWRLFRPDLEHPTRADFEPASQAMNALPIPWVDPVDISNAMLFLASDEARYITGVALPVDAGCLIK